MQMLAGLRHHNQSISASGTLHQILNKGGGDEWHINRQYEIQIRRGCFQRSMNAGKWPLADKFVFNKADARISSGSFQTSAPSDDKNSVSGSVCNFDGTHEQRPVAKQERAFVLPHARAPPTCEDKRRHLLHL